jgi:hypothetical protein
VTRILDSTGKTVAEIDSSCYLVEGEDPSLALYCRLDGNNEGVWGFLSRDGEILCEYPESLREYSTDDTEPVNGWFRVTDENSGKNGYVNTQGNKLLSDEWTEIRNFTGNGLARVKVGDFYGFIGTDGKYTTSPDWEYALDYFQADGLGLHRIKIHRAGRALVNRITVDSIHRLPLSLSILIKYPPRLRHSTPTPRTVVVPIDGGTLNSAFCREFITKPFCRAILRPPMRIWHTAVVLILWNETVVNG